MGISATRLHRGPLVVLGALIGILAFSLVAQGAGAASVKQKNNGKKIVFTAGAGEKNRLTVKADRKRRLLFKDRRARVKAKAGCKRLNRRRARCPAPDRKVVIKLRNRNDRVKVAPRVRTKIRGGRGRDRIKGGRARDTVKGGGGNDFIAGRGGADRLNGNRGKDHIQGRRGDDRIRGGRGNDLLKGGRGDDNIKGGGGNDKIIDDAYLKDFVGIDSQGTFQAAFNNNMNAMTTNLSAQAATGIKIHRQSFNWEMIETSRGNYDFTVTDRYMTKMAAHGMKVLPVLFDAPPFRTRKKDRPGMFSPPKRGRALGKFARALIARYGPKGSFWRHPALREYRDRSAITAWQIWNEPNLRQYWGGKPSARQYVRMLKKVRKQMRKAPGGKRAEIVSAGVPQSNIKGAVPLKRYIKRMYKAGLKRQIDTFGFNAYANNTRDLRRKLKRVRRWMNRAGDRKSKIWITEIGWASGGRKHRLRKGLRGQARQIKRAIRLIDKQRRKRKIRGFVYFNWRDTKPYREGISADTWGFHAGLLRRNGEFKPAHRAFTRAVAKLR